MKTKNLFSFGLLAAFLFAATPHSFGQYNLLGDQCKQWVVSPEWRFWLGSGTRVLMKLEQTLTVVTGKASYPIPDHPDRTGEVSGTVKGDTFEVQIAWANGQVSVYNGRIGAKGGIAGSTYDKAKPESKEMWLGDDQSMRCADPMTKPAQPPPTPAP